MFVCCCAGAADTFAIHQTSFNASNNYACRFRLVTLCSRARILSPVYPFLRMMKWPEMFVVVVMVVGGTGVRRFPECKRRTQDKRRSHSTRNESNRARKRERERERDNGFYRFSVCYTFNSLAGFLCALSAVDPALSSASDTYNAQPVVLAR